MKKIWPASLWLLVSLFMIAGVTMSAETSDIPVLIIPPDKKADAPLQTEKDSIINLVRQHFRLHDPDSPYGQVKVEIILDTTSGLRHLIVYLMHREIYLVESVRLTIDRDYKIVDIDKSPL